MYVRIFYVPAYLIHVSVSEYYINLEIMYKSLRFSLDYSDYLNDYIYSIYV